MTAPMSGARPDWVLDEGGARKRVVLWRASDPVVRYGTELVAIRDGAWQPADAPTPATEVE